MFEHLGDSTVERTCYIIKIYIHYIYVRGFSACLNYGVNLGRALFFTTCCFTFGAILQYA